MVTSLVTVGTLSALALGYVAHASLQVDTASQAPKPAKTSSAPRIDVVFVLDTTGSMSGLLEGAKEKIWSIANRIVSGQPRPDVRIGLVGYRDRGDDYITKVTSLTRDMDDVHQALLDFQPRGGGDGPEDVNAAMSAAIQQQPWQDGQQKSLKLIFLVGDAPPHDDYEGPKSWELAARAKEKGIIINTIRCGHMAETESAWRKIASVADGKFDSISQDGGVVAERSPYDDELAKLNSELADTVIAYGDRKARGWSARKMAARKRLNARKGAAAAAFNAKADRMNDEDLLTQINEGEVSVERLKKSSLPESMQGLSKKELKSKLAKARTKREEVKQKIISLSKKREAYLKKERNKKGSKVSEFDGRLMKSLSEQAARIDVAY